MIGEGPEGAAAHVHMARKILKRLRTGTRLLDGVVDRHALKRNRQLFRKTARLLAPSRDGTVRLQTFHDLVGSDAKSSKGALAAVRMRLAGEAAVGQQLAWEEADEALRILGFSEAAD